MKVLIVDVSSRALAQSAAAAGFEVISLDYFGDCDQPAAAEVYALGRDLHRPLALRELEARAGAVVVGAGLENEPALAGLPLHSRRAGQQPAGPRRGFGWLLAKRARQGKKVTLI